MIVILLALLIAIPSILLNGWVFSCLWAWFIAPLGAPSLGFVAAMGVYITVKFFKEGNTEGKEAESLSHAFGVIFLAPLVSLLFGYLLHLL